MSDEYFVYAVYKSAAEFASTVSRLQASGLKDVVALKDTSTDVSYSSAAIAHHTEKYLKLGGAIGAVLGGLAGAIATPHIPYAVTFQVLTPIMAAVSGAALGGYFGVWIGGFLYGIDKPNIQADVFEGTIARGSLLVGVTARGHMQRRQAMECMENDDLVELIVRSERLELPLRQQPALDEIHSAPMDVQLVA